MAFSEGCASSLSRGVSNLKMLRTTGSEYNILLAHEDVLDWRPQTCLYLHKKTSINSSTRTFYLLLLACPHTSTLMKGKQLQAWEYSSVSMTIWSLPALLRLQKAVLHVTGLCVIRTLFPSGSEMRSAKSILRCLLKRHQMALILPQASLISTQTVNWALWLNAQIELGGSTKMSYRDFKICLFIRINIFKTVKLSFFVFLGMCKATDRSAQRPECISEA